MVTSRSGRIALTLAEKGIKVAINYRQNEAALSDTVAKVKALGSDGFTVQADVAQPAAVSQLFQRVKSEFGSLDIFVANVLGDLFALLTPSLASTPKRPLLAAARGRADVFVKGVSRRSFDDRLWAHCGEYLPLAATKAVGNPILRNGQPGPGSNRL